MGVLRASRLTAWAVAALAGAALSGPAPADALVTPPVTLAGPSSEIVDFGGAAMAPDGSGGVVYTRAVGGVPHIFVSRYFRGSWSVPIRVDADQPYEASQPRIAAGRGGELMVVWVTQVATVKKKIRYGLYSAKIGRGASAFGPSLLVDPEVGLGTPAGVDPSLSGTAQGVATVAYRVITYRFDGSEPVQAVPLRPGDVLADIRVARLREDRWARLGAMNVSQELSVRPPSATNGPEVGAGIDGNAVVAWQESDQSGAARIYLRRIFGTVPGQILQVSPSSWEGTPVTGDADAFTLAVTPLNQARVAVRVAGNGGQGDQRLFLNTLPASFAVPSNAMLGSQLVFAAPAIGLPGVAAYEKGGQEGKLRLGFAAAGELKQLGVSGNGKLTALSALAGPAPLPGAETVAALDPDGGGTLAYPALDGNGRPAVVVNQEYTSGSAQLGLISSGVGGPVAQLRIGGSGVGDALIGFRQGEPGRFQIVAERVSSAPAKFRLRGPKGWVKPRAVRLAWARAETAVGGVTYAVIVGGRTAKAKLKRRQYRVPAGLLGDGATNVRVLAVDALGQRVLSGKLKLKVDGQAPIVRVSEPGPGGAVTVRVRDEDSGVVVKATRVSFGDGAREAGGARLTHVYAGHGRRTIVVKARDRAGNRTVRSFEVTP